jgi:hypothetical protein
MGAKPSESACIITAALVYLISHNVQEDSAISTAEIFGRALKMAVETEVAKKH